MTPKVVLDLQGTQSRDHRDRGVARYVHELASALLRRYPDRVAALLLNPDLTPPGRIEPFVASGRLRYAEDGLGDLDGAGVFHCMSPFELTVPLRRLWPPAAHAAGLRLVVTLYDLIPEVFADHYLADPARRRRYRAREELVRAADHVVALSRATADDAIEKLGLPDDRVTVIGGGVSDAFRPPDDRQAALAAVRAAVPGLEERYVLYTGGMEFRKNVERLVQAFALAHRGAQLVIQCQADELERNHWLHRATELGVPNRVLLPGFVPEDVLVLLNQAADLVVYPSLYEGFGLPVADAQACGARVIASGTSSIAELVDADARFDPTDVDDIARVLERGLSDSGFRAALTRWAERPAPRWDDVADRAVEVYDALAASPPRARVHRPDDRLAVVTPLPPHRSGVARYSYRLLEHLREHFTIDVFADGPRVPPHAPGGVSVHSVDQLDLLEALDGSYPRVLYCLGNSEYHTGGIAALRHRPGVVLAHDVRLTELYRHAANQPGAIPEGFHHALHRMYPDRLPPELGRAGLLTRDEADRWGVFMAREAIACSHRFLVHSTFAAQLARLDAEPLQRDKVAVVPFGIQDAGPVVERGVRTVVASFGIVNAIKQDDKLVGAFARVARDFPDATLAIVGPASDDERAALDARARALRVGDRVRVTGAVDDAEYEQWLATATVAVQLRAASNGEASATVGDTLAHGVPTVVTGIGAAGDVPDDAVAKVAPDATEDELAAVIAGLLGDDEGRRRMSDAATHYRGQHAFADVAAEIARVLAAVRPG